MIKEFKKKLKQNVRLKHFIWRIKSSLNYCLYNDRDYLCRKYKQTNGYLPNLETPISFNDKLLWSQLNHRNNLYVKYADKFAVREFIQEKIGARYLIKCLGIYRKWEEIDFETLPQAFVLKATHGSGWNFLCPDKSKLNLKDCEREVRYWLSTDYYSKNREWNYKYIEPRVICEEFIGDQFGNPPLDYKFFCFNGVVKFIQLDIDRYNGHKRNVYAPDWTQMRDVKATHDQDFSREYKKPEKWDEMLKIAERLSEGFEHVRVDLYNVDNCIYFGEMTFFHGGGIYERFLPESFHEEIGSWFTLPERNIDVWKKPNKYIN